MLNNKKLKTGNIIEGTNKMQPCSRIYYSNASSLFNIWFYIRFWLPAAAMAEPPQRPATKTYVKPEAKITVFELLMMGSVSPETC
jgi:hypothetical protein